MMADKQVSNGARIGFKEDLDNEYVIVKGMGKDNASAEKKELEVIGKDDKTEKCTKIFEDMGAPMALVLTEGGKFIIQEETIKILKKVDKPMVVVSIVGLYRTGKSYLMNRLADKQGFQIGNAIQAQTKGIWIWIRPHPLHDDRILVLMDSEGLGDAEKGDPRHDAQLFALVVLLSSTLVYNSKGSIDQDALDRLNFVANLSDHIRLNKSSVKPRHLDEVLPSFIWVLRDFTLFLEVDGEEISADQYLEHCLTTKQQKKKVISRYNDIRLKIRNYFKERKCFTFPMPVMRAKLLRTLHTVADGCLNEDFLEESSKFCKYVFEKSHPKLLEDGQQVNGSMMGCLIENYVKAMNDGAVPCISDAVEAMSILENQKAMEVAYNLYLETVNKELKMPTTQELATEIFLRANEKAVKLFVVKSVMDKNQTYQKALGERIKGQNSAFLFKNKEASKQVCNTLLDTLYNALMEKFRSGDYSKSGGFQAFTQDIDRLQVEYLAVPNKGLEEQSCLINFMQKSKTVRDAVMRLDEQLSEEAKKRQREIHEKEMEQLRAQELEKKNKELNDRAEEEKRMYQANLEELHKKHAENVERSMKQQEEMITKRLNEQAKLLEEGHDTEVKKLQREIQDMKDRMSSDSADSGGCFSASSLIKVQSNDKIVTKKLKELEMGDLVQSYDEKSRKIVFSKMYFMTHSRSFVKQTLLELATSSRRIQLEENHLIYFTDKEDVNNFGKPNCPMGPVCAKDVAVDGYLWVTIDGSEGLSPEKVIGKGHTLPCMFRHPMTMNHNIIVDGVRASVHMFNETAYRALTKPLRILYNISPKMVASPVVEKIVEFWDNVEEYF